MLLKDKVSWRNSLPIYFTSSPFYYDSNLELQNNLLRSSAWLTEIASFYFWKMFHIILEYWKLQKFVWLLEKLEKMFELLRLCVVVKESTSSSSVVFVCSFQYASFYKQLSVFCSSNVFSQFFKVFFPHMLIFNNGT